MDEKVEKNLGGRPRSGTVLLTLRLEPEVIAFYRNGKPGWLKRVNDTLRGAMDAQLEAEKVAAAKAWLEARERRSARKDRTAKRSRSASVTQKS